MTVSMNYNASTGGLTPWVPKSQETDERAASTGRLVVMKTNGAGERVLISQPGHPAPTDLARQIGARIKVPKKLSRRNS